ncbi:MAG: hypothetical protein JO009_05070 [Candidatus Eremiobacteraeota bacterium]|nr:hypothetical protein [Candidatus Eremiobacteraeota bacterium]
MATPISIANIARVAAGALALVWALVALGEALAALTARGVDVLLAAEIATAALLATGALMSFGRRRWWRFVLVIAAAALTVVRLVSVLGTGDTLLVATSVAMFVAIAVVAAVATPGNADGGRTAGRPNPRHTGVPPSRPHIS